MKFLAMLVPYILNHLVKHILIAFGVSIITYVGFDMVIGNLKEQIIASMGAVPAGAIQIFYIAGGGVVLNIMFGLLAFVVTFKTLSKIGFKGKGALWRQLH